MSKVKYLIFDYSCSEYNLPSENLRPTLAFHDAVIPLIYFLL